MIRAIYFNNQGEIITNPASGQFKTLLEDTDGLFWLDFWGEQANDCQPILSETFHFHPLAIDDALSESHVPKLDDWNDYLYIVLHAISFNREAGETEISELDVFLGKNYIVTHHDLPIQALNRVWENAQKDERHHRHGPDHILYRISDELVVDFMQAVEEIDLEVDTLEDIIFQHPSPNEVQRIFRLKRSSLTLRRSLSPLREVFNKLARDEYAVVDSRDRVYFRDVYDHLVRLHDISEGLRDMVGGVLDTYLSVVSNRMNEIMKTLTIITTIFMPISFVAGFFGMNFFQPVASKLVFFSDVPSFELTLLIIILVPIGMLWWMMHRKWI